MPRKDSLYTMPENLPIPIDDGACNHLLEMKIPRVPLLSTTGEIVDLSNSIGRTVVYYYPRTGHPDQDPPNGWNEIPGARGCTPQSCAFKDHY
jgi:peroxiredoxin